MATYRVVLADDHLLFREGMKRLIEEMPGMEVVGEAGDGLELLTLAKELKPDMAIIDISMPNLRGIETTREIKMINPLTKVLILTMHKSKDYLYHSISAGADGYLLKEDSDMELFSAIDKIRNGEIYVTRILVGELAEDLSQIQQNKGRPFQEPLTTREKEVMKMVSEGKSNNEIATLLNISVRTVENHRANIMRKLKLKKTADLVRYAIKEGLV
ncbi:MAG: response regulator transcription factor [Desulfobacteraceae bacterium]